MEYVKLIRPSNVIITLFSVFIGAFICGKEEIFLNENFLNVLLACFSAGFVAGGANAINDFFDIEIDRVNKPTRPIASGKISLKAGFIFSVIMFVIGILLSVIINWQTFIIAFLTSLLLYLYSAKLKRTVIWGNLTVSLATALAFVYGGIAINKFYYSIIPAVFSFFFHLGREIIKDAEDIEGDSKNNAITFPVKYGITKSLVLTSSIFILLIILTILPYLFKIYGANYLAVVILGVDFVLVYVMISMWINSSSRNLGKLSNILKADMLVGLIAIYVG
jgi:geranylgeranylglycerol-phosphate geranylgeranyltransferase